MLVLIEKISLYTRVLVVHGRPCINPLCCMVVVSGVPLVTCARECLRNKVTCRRRLGLKGLLGVAEVDVTPWVLRSERECWYEIMGTHSIIGGVTMGSVCSSG
jgi:hypothetical protein